MFIHMLTDQTREREKQISQLSEVLIWSTYKLFDFTALTERFAARCFTLNVRMRSKDSAQQTKVKRRRVALTVRHTTELLQEPWKRRCQELCLGSVFKVCKVVCVPVVTPDLMVTWRPVLLALTCSVVDVHAAQQIRFFAYPKCERSEDELKIRPSNSREMSDSGGSQQSLCYSWSKLK